MNNQKLILAIAIVLGLAVAYMIAGYTNNLRMELSGKAKQVEILVATDDLITGVTLGDLHSRKMVKAKSMPKEYVAEGALTADDQLGDRILAQHVSKNEQLTAQKFKIPKEAGLAFATPNDKVAVSVPTNAMRAVGNLIKIGDYVNVIGTIKDQSGQQVTKTILQRVQVLAIGSRLEESQDGGGFSDSSGMQSSGSQKEQAITLALSQAEAEKLVFVQEQGQVWLTLVPPAQGETGILTPGQTLTTILK